MSRPLLEKIKVTTMPFPNQDPRPFTRGGIERLAAGQRGCYGLFQNGGPWVYVGRSDDIRARLLQHLDETVSLIKRAGPTHFVTVLSVNDVMLEKALIVELQPVANQKVG